MDGTTALIFIALCIFIPMLLAHSVFKASEKTVVRYKEIYVPTVDKPVKNTRPEPVVPSIFNDAVEVLIELGMKKMTAKEKVAEMFKKKQYNSIESFIMDVYKK